jgi:hypothetical protein
VVVAATGPWSHLGDYTWRCGCDPGPGAAVPGLQLEKSWVSHTVPWRSRKMAIPMWWNAELRMFLR